MNRSRRKFLIEVSKGLALSCASGLMAPELVFASFNTKTHRKKRLRLVVSANTTNYNVYSALQASGWSFSTAPNTALDITLIINSGIYVYSTSVSNAGIESGSLPAGSVIRVFNSGYILGMGGAGGGYNMPAGVNGQAGGHGISTNSHMIIDNLSGYICGGGGGGGGVFWNNDGANFYSAGGGGGAGGGVGGSARFDANAAVSGGSGGGPDLNGSNGSVGSNGVSSGGGGGRKLPGSTTITNGPSYTSTSLGRAGLGGSGGGSGAIRTLAITEDGSGNLYFNPYGSGTKGGDGGGGSSSGGAGAVTASPSGDYRLAAGGGGGDWGQAGGAAAGSAKDLTVIKGTGGAAGKAINTGTSGKSIIWIGGTSSSSRTYGSVG